jgi:hypothetical protein
LTDQDNKEGKFSMEVEQEPTNGSNKIAKVHVRRINQAEQARRCDVKIC